MQGGTRNSQKFICVDFSGLQSSWDLCFNIYVMNLPQSFQGTYELGDNFDHCYDEFENSFLNIFKA